MLSTLPKEIQDELDQLAQRFGEPLLHVADLGIYRLFDPLNKTDRYGEVCMVVRRPNGHLLTMKKTFYPYGAFRLMTGGIQHGESILDALLRETYEETGLQVNIRRFLAAVAYRANGTNDSPVFYTFAFLLDEIGGALGTIDEGEHVESFREIEPEALLSVAEFLEHVQDNYSQEIDGKWRDWGRFRAVIHRVVWEALADG